MKNGKVEKAEKSNVINLLFHSPSSFSFYKKEEEESQKTKTIIVTGATSGIGNLLVREFAKRNHCVFAGYRKLELKKELGKISENVIPFYIDMSKKWTVTNAAKFILERAEKIDALINAAGSVFAGPMECLDVDIIRKQFEVNTFAHLQFTQELFSKLCGGKIINISSEASFGIFPFIAPYCASKRALDILFNSMQIESAGKCKEGGIKVVSVKPGVIRTPLWDKSIEVNKDILGDNTKYKQELEFLMQNAKKNNTRGLKAEAVVNFILKIEALKNPKSSYTIGLDAKMTEIISHLPQDWINFIIKKTLKKKCVNC